jgi:hypothetical protein
MLSSSWVTTAQFFLSHWCHAPGRHNINGSEGALSNPESHMFGLLVVGGAGSLLLRRAEVCVVSYYLEFFLNHNLGLPR